MFVGACSLNHGDARVWARYGLAMPEVDFVGVENGRSYTTGVQIPSSEASLGADKLARELLMMGM